MMTTLNGSKPRKQLSDQLDRMDGIIDALAEGLPEAVADATRDGTRQAIREALADLAADPQVIAMMRAAFTPIATTQTPAQPSLFAKLAAAVRSALAATTTGIAATAGALYRSAKAKVSAIKAKFAAIRSRTVSVVRTVRIGVPARKTLLTAGGVGLAVVVAAQTNHTVASVLAGAAAVVATAAVQVGLRVRRFVRQYVRA